MRKWEASHQVQDLGLLRADGSDSKQQHNVDQCRHVQVMKCNVRTAKRELLFLMSGPSADIAANSRARRSLAFDSGRGDTHLRYFVLYD